MKKLYRFVVFKDKKAYFGVMMLKRIYIFFLMLCSLTGTAVADEPVVLSNYTFKRFTTHDGLSQMQTETIWQDSKGYIYIGTLSGFVRYDGKFLQPFLKGKRINIVGFAETSKGVSAFGFRRKWEISGEDLRMKPLTDWGGMYNNFNSPNLPNGMVLIEDSEERNRRLGRLTDKGLEIVFSHPVLDKMTPDRKLFVDDGDIYIPTEEGLYLHRKNKLTKLSGKHDVFTLIRNQSKLYAMAADGIYSVEDNKLTNVVSFEFSDPDYGLSVCQDKNGRLFIADSHSLYVFDGKTVSLLSGGFNMIKHLFCDVWGRLWMATYQGAYLFYNINFETHRLADTNDIVRAICLDKEKRLVMGTLNGKVMVNDSIVSDIDGNYYSPNAALVAGKVYMPGNGDIICIDGGKTEWMGLPHDKYVFVAPHGEKMLIGTRQAILDYDPSDGKIDTLTTEIVRPWCAAIDAERHVWVGATYGLFMIDNALDPLTRQHKIIRKDYKDDFLTVSTMTTTPKGDIFAASCDSLFLVSNGEIACLCERIPQIKDHEIRSLHFSPKGFLVIAAVDGLLVAKLDEDYNVEFTRWFDHTNGFTSLEPLNAQMCEEPDGTIWLPGIDEVTSFVPATLMAMGEDDTVIEPPTPWWRKWWVLSFFILALLLMGWWVLSVYEKRQVRRTLFKLQREKRQKELLIQAIRLKSFPHFHANVMAGIEYMMMNNIKEAGKYMKIYSDFTNQTLSDIDSTSRSIAEEVDYTLLYLQLEKIRYAERLNYDIYVADNVNMQTQIPTMLIYTYVQNAIKHGIGNKPEGGILNINVTRQSNRVIVSVTDNGVGREEAKKLNRNSTRMGLRILLEQIELYNQTNREHIIQTISDLHDAEGNDTGTTFEMSIPIDYNYSIEKQK